MQCGLCQRRMQGTWNNDKPHYRCVYPEQYALANHVEHPRSLYVREEQIVPALDRWLATSFAPDHLATTIKAMADAQASATDSNRDHQAEHAAQTITECDRKLARYRAALEAGTDPTIVNKWITEVTLARTAAQAAQRRLTGQPPQRLTEDEIAAIIDSLGNTAAILADADPADKAKIYIGLGLRLTYEPGRKAVIAEAAAIGDHVQKVCRRPNTSNIHTVIASRHIQLISRS
jgi:hypothetical protein